MLNDGMAAQPKISVGIIDHSTHVTGRLEGKFYVEHLGSLSGSFSAKAAGGTCLLFDQAGREVARAPEVRLSASRKEPFRLFNVTIGNQFHWQRTEEQMFHGDLILVARTDDTVTAINEVPLEEYLASVISSEMRATAPEEFLKAHAVSSRSWLLAALQRKNKTGEAHNRTASTVEKEEEVIRWYDREQHDLFDVCADDHCQRYQGITKIISGQAEAAVSGTEGKVILYGDEICDARYSKACGGLTEESNTAWSDERVPYLASIPDTAVPFDRIRTEEEAVQWILSEPHAYCNTRDVALLETILPEIDRETQRFFRWTIAYPAGELAEILREKSGFDFGMLNAIVPLGRGPSGRISRLKIVGSKMSMIVGKELEIRRWLSKSHLYSSAFIVTVEHNHRGEPETFIFRGAGWGHGVGLCQIGAAVMASQGFSAEEILKHYFQGVEIRKIY
ncbi:MAG: sporulation related protein [Deltaproteobacteria bacterium]|jgi:SpoIID/LytB domain protein|nr:sporulation related protein [Deltaproteobacteria bacterium]